MVQTKGHNVSYLTPVGRVYKRERVVRRKHLCSPHQNIKRRRRFQRRKVEDTYAVRVEGRSMEGFISLLRKL
jgi:hypothetical protein